MLKRGRPVSTLNREKPRDRAIPMERPFIMAVSDMVPPVMSATCLLSTCTAGSAFTMK